MLTKTGTLSHEQARHFRTQGYYRLPSVYTKEETADMRAFVEEEAAHDAELRESIGAAAVKMYGLYDRNRELMHRVITNPVLVGALQSILGPNIVLVKNRHNHATVNNRQGRPAEGLHRDILQPTRALVTAAIYLEESTVDNGATRIIPGSHELPYVGAPQADGGGTWLADHEEYQGMEDQAIPVPMPAGGVLLFNGLTFHGVGGNVSGGSRMSMTLGLRAADELACTPDLEREVLIAGEYIYRGNDR
jgi:phytanoyl-CoA hydroxylase